MFKLGNQEDSFILSAQSVTVYDIKKIRKSRFEDVFLHKTHVQIWVDFIGYVDLIGKLSATNTIHLIWPKCLLMLCRPQEELLAAMPNLAYLRKPKPCLT